MSAETVPLPSITDPYEYLQISLNPDGTLTRRPNAYPRTSATPLSNISTEVLSKDIPISPEKNTWARIFLPKQALVDPMSANKLPLLVYFHGGGFILGSPDLTMFHEFCSNIASELPVMVLSATYRLSPEHRLPAAYDDGMEALHRIKTIQDDWLRDYADYTNCYLMGSSAGANLVYYVGLRAAQEIDNLFPLKIKGLILHQPFFGGVQRTESESRLVNDPFFPPCVSDLMWELSLPIGVDRDHKYCNPMGGGGSFTILEKIKRLGWRVLVTGCDGDQLIDRQIELMKMMEEKEIQVVGRFGVGGFHGFELVDSSKAKALHVVLKNFMLSSM
ncbi:probable carboxylesterase 120 [Durio zibethinus]|uniref:Probable carboxylesterase 120 n=1 Tax=Durio zibethinus TaxID=66656 RepID=A0A6P5WQ12_DURZI|nr:probable carboxylesterase 120 [Durio zibethinus]